MKYHILRHNPAMFDRNHPEFLTDWAFMDQAHAEMLSPGDVAVVLTGLPVDEFVAVVKVADAPAYQRIIEPDSGWSDDEVGQGKWIRKLEGGYLLPQPVPVSVLLDDPRCANLMALRRGAFRPNPHPVNAAQFSAIAEAILLESLKSTVAQSR